MIIQGVGAVLCLLPIPLSLVGGVGLPGRSCGTEVRNSAQTQQSDQHALPLEEGVASAESNG